MRKVFEYSHLGGLEILKVRYPKIDREIDEVIKSVDIKLKTKISKEKTKKGKELFSPKEMNEKFRKGFTKRGFKELKDPYFISSYDDKKEIRVFKQIDFVKDRVLVEVQFGKYAFMFYDLAKFQYFYNKEKADVGVEIVPSYYLHREMSTGVSYGEQLINDIKRLERNFPSVPVKIILIEV
ncbi:MAG TPA: BstYI [Thermoplasmatales archaeon]|nr:BstYI [Thermoplasmatales archaeon]